MNDYDPTQYDDPNLQTEVIDISNLREMFKNNQLARTVGRVATGSLNHLAEAEEEV